jgi:ribonuclease P protein component
MYTKQTFSKAEKLCNKKLIDKLFTKGTSFFSYPFKVIYFFAEANDSFTANYPAKVLFTTSKRHFKKAVDRNRIKRLLRESYRKNKSSFYDELDKKGLKLVIGFIFNGKELPLYRDVEKKIIDIIHRLTLEINKRGK